MATYPRTNIQRIAAILKGFGAANRPRATQRVLGDLGIARSTGFALVRAMVKDGWLERIDHGHVRLGPSARALAFGPIEAHQDRQSSVVAVAVTPGAPAGAARAEPKGTDLEWDPALIDMADTAGFRTPPPWRIGFSNASQSNAWRKAMVQSIKYARHLRRGEIASLDIRDAQDDPERQCRQIDAMVKRGIDLLMVSTSSATHRGLSDLLNALAKDGLPAVAVDRRPNDRASLVSFVTASDRRIGRTSAVWLAEHLKGEGRVWLLSGIEGTSPAIRRQQAALSVFSEFPGIRIENVRYTRWTPESGAAVIAHLLSEAPAPPDGVWCDSGLQGVGSVQHFVDRGLKVPAHTGGELNAMYKLCLHYRVPMVALDYPASMGARALETALNILMGRDVPRRVEIPLQVVLPRGCETHSVKADAWAECHVAWDTDGDTILSAGPVLRTGSGTSNNRRKVPA